MLFYSKTEVDCIKNKCMWLRAKTSSLSLSLSLSLCISLSLSLSLCISRLPFSLPSVLTWLPGVDFGNGKRRRSCAKLQLRSGRGHAALVGLLGVRQLSGRHRCLRDRVEFRHHHLLREEQTGEVEQKPTSFKFFVSAAWRRCRRSGLPWISCWWTWSWASWWLRASASPSTCTRPLSTVGRWARTSASWPDSSWRPRVRAGSIAGTWVGSKTPPKSASGDPTWASGWPAERVTKPFFLSSWNISCKSRQLSPLARFFCHLMLGQLTKVYDLEMSVRPRLPRIGDVSWHRELWTTSQIRCFWLRRKFNGKCLHVESWNTLTSLTAIEMNIAFSAPTKALSNSVSSTECGRLRPRPLPPRAGSTRTAGPWKMCGSAVSMAGYGLRLGLI